jgi:putative hemolysin
MQQARALYRRVRSAPEGFRLESVLAEMRIDLNVLPSDFQRIPAKGPLVAVTNHPFGVLGGMALAVLLSRVRSDVRVVADSLLAGIPELHQHCFFLDPVHTPASAVRNLNALKRAEEWLRTGGALAVFPAGDAPHIDTRRGKIPNLVRETVAARLVRKTGASALPVYCCGGKSGVFQTLGSIHPQLRALFLLQEFLQCREKPTKLRIGKPIPFELITGLDNDEEATEHPLR